MLVAKKRFQMAKKEEAHKNTHQYSSDGAKANSKPREKRAGAGPNVKEPRRKTTDRPKHPIIFLAKGRQNGNTDGMILVPVHQTSRQPHNVPPVLEQAIVHRGLSPFNTYI